MRVSAIFKILFKFVVWFFCTKETITLKQRGNFAKPSSLYKVLFYREKEKPFMSLVQLGVKHPKLTCDEIKSNLHAKMNNSHNMTTGSKLELSMCH